MNGFLYILSGASGSGKTTLMNDICLDESMKAVKAPKFSERERRDDDDDIEHVEHIEVGEDIDLAYIINGKCYGISTRKIHEQLEAGFNSFIILSDFRIVKKMKSLFGDRAKSVYISSAIDPQALLKVHGSRHAFRPEEEQKKALHNQFSRLKSAARLEMWPNVFNCMSELLVDWRRFIPDSQSAEIRAQKIRSFHNRYIDKIALFDHVILNTEGLPTDMGTQMRNLMRFYNLHGGARAAKSHPVLFVVAAASGAGKGLLMETLNNIIGKQHVAIVTKMARREKHDDDHRDGMIAIGEDGVFPDDFDLRWWFHQSDITEGTEYAVSTAEIQQNIHAGKQQVLISNMNEFDRFRERFGNHAVFLYLHALRPEEEIRRYQFRHWPKEKAEYRIKERREVHENYMERIAEFDHVLLNTAFPEDLFDQMFELVENYANSPT